MKRYLLLGTLAAMAFAQNPKQMTMEEKVDLLWMQSETGTKGAYTAPGHPDTGHDFLLAFDILYWHPKTDLTEVGGSKVRTAVSSTNQYNGSRSPYIDFDWEFGFKFGVGYHFDTREWDLMVQYTRVQFTDSFSTNPGARRYMHSNFGSSRAEDEEVFAIKGSHKIDYQTVTAELSRQYFLNRFLSMRPGFGAKVAWINQYPHIINQTNLNDSPSFQQHVYLTEKTVAVGPMASMGSNWYLFKGWSFYADGGLALLFTRYRGRMSVEGESADAPFRQSNKEEKHYVTPNLMLNLGLQYEKFFSESEQHVTVSIGYESQYYINQSYMMQNRRVQDNNSFQGAWFARNLAVYGLTVHAAYEF